MNTLMLRGGRAALVSLTLLVWLCTAGAAWGQSARTQRGWDAANRAYQQGQWQQAAEGYREVQAAGVESSALDYNLANAYAQLGDLGRARLFYERALRMTPRDPDLRANRAALTQKIHEQDAFSASLPLTSNELVGVTSMFWVAAAALLGVSLRYRRLAWAWLAAIPLMLMLVSGGLLSLRCFQDQRWAVVIPPEVKLLDGPGRNFATVTALQAGSSVRILRSSGNWKEVSGPSGQRGWLRSEQVEKLNSPSS